MMTILANLLAGLGLGIAFGFFLYSLSKNLEKKRASLEAKEIIDQSKEQAELVEMDLKELQLEIEEELWGKNEAQLLKTEEKITELEEIIEEKKTSFDNEIKNLKKSLEPKTQELAAKEKSLGEKTQSFEARRNNSRSINGEFINALCEKSSNTREQIKSEITLDLEENTRNSQAKWLNNFDIYLQEDLEVRAKGILATALNRFARPYCSERGIAGVLFPDDKTRELFMVHFDANIKMIQDQCGCDIYVEPENPMISFAGFDPVRRELTRRTLERVLREKRGINPEIIKKRSEEAKKELFRQIKTDGDNLAKELKLEGLHTEIRQMMGSLRYRYSFTQNQYFHCSEVGWICGLLASELNLEIRKARRAGMLHDIGKSMDHAMDGGHAVIGADFIEARNESKEIVHAVRAHHFDEQPSTELAFLVIAADAMSGARPGARRSTVESYTQKVTDLENIALAQDGVHDAFVLSGGRELRVFVDGKKVDDSRSITMARDIATRIEAEMNYPGQIKVVIVRSTIAQETTRQH